MTGFLLQLYVLSLSSNLAPWVNVVALLTLVIPFLSIKIRNSYYRRTDPWAPQRWLLAAYAYWIVSYLLSEAPIANFFSFEFLRKDGALFFSYLPLLLVCDYRLSPRTTERIIRSFVAMIGAIGLLGAIQYLTPYLSNVPQWLNVVGSEMDSGLTFHGFYEAHNAAGVAYALAASLCVSFLIYRRKKLASFSTTTVILVLTLAGLFFTKSRTGYVAFFGGCILPFILNPRELKKRLKWITLLVLPLLVVIISQPQVLKRIEAIANTRDANVEMRIPAFEKAWQDFKMSPIIGIGFGRYNDDGLSFYGVPHLFYLAIEGGVVNASSHAHDSYLQFLAEGGLIGFILMMGIWYSIYKEAERIAYNTTVGSFEYALAKSVQASVIVACMASFTEHSLGTGMAPLIVTTLAGLLRNFQRKQTLAAPGQSTGIGCELPSSSLRAATR